MAPSTPTTALRRRSARLRGVSPTADDNQERDTATNRRSKRSTGQKRKRSVIAASKTKTPPKKSSSSSPVRTPPSSLSRTRETQLTSSSLPPKDPSNNQDKNDGCSFPVKVIGVDEAGRGPLAGPIVAAAVILPADLDGITDSKKLIKEEVREELYGDIVASPDVRWAVAVVDAETIDRINILQATMEAMRIAVSAVVSVPSVDGTVGAAVRKEGDDSPVVGSVVARREEGASSDHKGCYVVCGGASGTTKMADDLSSHRYYALIDGNRIPKAMPCPAEPMVKGDSREYSIAAASILAKVTRDRLMRDYGERYPEYELGKHKGYPTPKHKAKVREIGASPIHRRTFAPLKNMVFDGDGKVVEDNN